MKITATPWRVMLLLYLAICLSCKGRTESAPTPENFTATETVQSTDYTEPQGATMMRADQTVYICVSKGAKRYHPDKSCSGLRHCTHEIRKTTVKDAESIGLTLCHLEY